MTFDETALQQSGGNASPPVGYNPDEFWLRTLLRWYIGLVIRPSPTIREIVERRPVWAGLGAVWLQTPFWAVIWLAFGEYASFSQAFSQPMDILMTSFFALVLLAIPAVPIVLVLALFFHAGSRLMGGLGDWRRTFFALMMSMFVGFVPATIGIAALFPLEAANLERSDPAGNWVVTSLILMGTIWVAGLAILVVRHSYGFRIGRSAAVTLGSAIVGIPVVTVIFAAYVIALALLAFALAGPM